MSTGFWIVLVLVALGIVMFRSTRSGPSQRVPAEPDLDTRFKNRDAMIPEVLKEAVRMAEALPIVDQATSWLLHEPVYDAKTDTFDPPCAAREFGDSAGRCWESIESLSTYFRNWWAEPTASFRTGISRPLTDVIVPARDHLDVISCFHSVNEPGLRVVRVTRVAEDRWHTHVWTCGFAPGANSMVMGTSDGRMRIELASAAGQVDPPLLARDVANDSSLWVQRNAAVRDRWPKDRNWREAAGLCTHR